MIDNQAVCSTHVLCAKQIHAKHLWRGAAVQEQARFGSMQGVGLRRMLMGLPLSQRSEASDTLERRDLDRHLSAVSALMPELYGTSEACKQAQMELDTVVELEGEDSLECKRAALLFALSREKELGLHLEEVEREVDGSSTLVEDLRKRVLPFVFPRFLRNLCQTPDSMVVLSCVLAEMWAGEPLGNYGGEFEGEEFEGGEFEGVPQAVRDHPVA